jgi:hypothetical protein
MKTVQTITMNYDRPIRIALIIGVIAAIIAVTGLFISGPGLFFQAYLFAFLFWLGISLGSLALLLLHFLTGSRWGLAIRRVTEAGAGSIWVMALLFIPILIGLPFLYTWARPAEVAGSPLLQQKAFYLNIPFFVIRAVIYFIVWGLLAFFTNRLAARYAESNSRNESIRGRLRSIGAFGLIAYFVTMTFAAVDWLMSLQPEWTSTAFGLVLILAQALTGMSFAILVLNLFPDISQGRQWTERTTPVPYKDLGSLMLTLVMGWAYVAFFQMLIVWAGNIPREVVWYLSRMEGGWSIFAIAIAIFQFAVPFILLLSIPVRHNLRILAGIGVVVLLINLVNMFWQVKPAFSPSRVSVSWLDIVVPVAIGGIWFAAFLNILKRRPVLNAVDQVNLDIRGEVEKAIP